MKKRLLTLFLVLVMVISIVPSTTFSVNANANNNTGTLDAIPTSSSVYINGKKIAFEAYTINGSNYFKLRDLAVAFNATNKRFAIDYNEATNTVGITVGSPYTAVGGEMRLGDGYIKSASPSNSKIFWTEDASLVAGSVAKYYVNLGTYMINGNNFVKLRDLLQWLDVGVGYDEKTASISISTAQGYVHPKFYGNPLAGAELIDNKYRSDYGQAPGSIHNSSEIVYHEGWYYLQGSKIQEGGKVVPYKGNYGDLIPDNFQVYGNKIFFEGASSSSITNQYVVSMNLDGSGIKYIISNSLYNGNNITIYKGKLYANTHGTEMSIVSYNLDGTNKKTLYTGNIASMPEDITYGDRGYHIFDDRIYFMSNTNGNTEQIYSVKLDGTDRKIVATVDNMPYYILSVYDGYIYYETVYAGLHRIKIGEQTSMCVIPGSVNADKYAIYGNKIVFVHDAIFVGVVNTDGTGRYQFPNAKQDYYKETTTWYANLAVLNSKYTFAQSYLYNNDSAVPGRIEFFGKNSTDPDADTRGWFPISEPSINNLPELIPYTTTPAQNLLKDGWFNLRCMNNYLYIDAKGNAELRTTTKKQKFYIEHKNDKYFTIKTEDGKYLGVDVDAKSSVRIKVVDTEYMWLIRYEDKTDIFSMRSGNFPNMVLNASGEKKADGTHIIFWYYGDQDAKNHAEFRFIPVN